MGENIEDKNKENSEAKDVQENAVNTRIEDPKMADFVARVKAQNHEAAKRLVEAKQVKKEASKEEQLDNPVIEPVSKKEEQLDNPIIEATSEEVEEIKEQSNQSEVEPTPEVENIEVDETQKENIPEKPNTKLKIIVSGKGVKIGDIEFSYKDLITQDRFYGVMSIWEKCIRYESVKQAKYLEILRQNIGIEKLEKLDFRGDQFILTALVKASHSKEEFIRYMNEYYELITPPYEKVDKKNPAITYNLNKKAIGAKFKAWLVAKEDFPLECYEEFIEEEAYRAKDYAKVKASPIVKLKFKAKDVLAKVKQKTLDKVEEKAKKQEIRNQSEGSEIDQTTRLNQWSRQLSEEEIKQHNAKIEEAWGRLLKNQEEQAPEQESDDKDLDK